MAMASPNGHLKPPVRAPIAGNAPDPHAIPSGLMTWRTRVGDSEYALFSFPIGESTRWASLTPRERTVASEVLRGLANGEIADRLQIAERTVANQVAAIFRKLRVGSRGEFALFFAHSLGPQKTNRPR
jgi:DNA-binding CsgD family transcriptional regulator